MTEFELKRRTPGETRAWTQGYRAALNNVEVQLAELSESAPVADVPVPDEDTVTYEYHMCPNCHRSFYSKREVSAAPPPADNTQDQAEESTVCTECGYWPLVQHCHSCGTTYTTLSTATTVEDSMSFSAPVGVPVGDERLCDCTHPDATEGLHFPSCATKAPAGVPVGADTPTPTAIDGWLEVDRLTAENRRLRAGAAPDLTTLRDAYEAYWSGSVQVLDNVLAAVAALVREDKT